MLSKIALLGAGFVVLTASAAFAADQSERYTGAPGSVPDGADMVYFNDFANGTDTYYHPADGENIPAGTGAHPVDVTVTSVGRTTQVTATPARPDVSVASH